MTLRLWPPAMLCRRYFFWVLSASAFSLFLAQAAGRVKSDRSRHKTPQARVLCASFASLSPRVRSKHDSDRPCWPLNIRILPYCNKSSLGKKTILALRTFSFGQNQRPDTAPGGRFRVPRLGSSLNVSRWYRGCGCDTNITKNCRRGRPSE